MDEDPASLFPPIAILLGVPSDAIVSVQCQLVPRVSRKSERLPNLGGSLPGWRQIENPSTHGYSLVERPAICECDDVSCARQPRGTESSHDQGQPQEVCRQERNQVVFRASVLARTSLHGARERLRATVRYQRVGFKLRPERFNLR